MSDTGIKLSRTLDEVLDIGRDKADAIANAIIATQTEHLASKADLKELELRLSKLIATTAVWAIGVMVPIGGAMLAIAVWSLHVWPVRL